MKILSRVILIVLLVCVFFFAWTNVIVWQSEKNYPPIGSFIEKGNSKLHYIKAGTGQPIILIHGDGGSLYDWKMSCFDTLARQFTTIAIDRPGLGYSSTLPEQSIQAQVEFLHQCLPALTVQKPILICHSRGAELGMYMALKYPADIAGLITLGGSCISTESNEPSWQYKLLQTPGVGWFIVNTFYIPVSKPFIKVSLDKAFSPDKPAPPGYVDAYAAFLMKPQQFMNWSKDNKHDFINEFLIPNYKNIKTPMVIVNGEKDRNITLAQAQVFHKQVPGSTLLVIPNTGHELQFNRPESIFMALDSLNERL